MATPLSLTPEQEEALLKNIVACALQGMRAKEISETLNIGINTIRRRMQSEQYKELLKSNADDAVASAKAQLRAQALRLSPKAERALEQLLDSTSGKDRAEGLRAYFRLIGVEADKDGGGNAPLHIHFPGTKPESFVAAESGGQDEDQSGGS